ncbi:hypothetical protein [Streptomyces sp. NPDC057301]|uniref:hypothetical protein n=1 Tax=Streptomyces sp. NPDC057301 TaxID=3346093 RepID=UPI003628B0B9
MNYTLEELEPPGSLYEEWFQVEEGMDTSFAASDPRISADALDLMQRLARLAKPYAGRVPQAALMLDMALDSGFLPLRQGDGGIMVPLDEAAAMLPSAWRAHAGSVDVHQVRESVHELHGVGALLMELVEDTAIGRLVARRPEHRGEPWVFVDEEPEKVGPKTCLPNGAVAELTSEEFAAFGYLRSCEAAGDEATAGTSVNGWAGRWKWSGPKSCLLPSPRPAGWMRRAARPAHRDICAPGTRARNHPIRSTSDAARARTCPVPLAAPAPG